MKKILLIMGVATFMFACSNSEEKKEETEAVTTSETEEETTASETSSEYVMNNYAVVWNWTAEDKAYIDARIPEQSEQLIELWKKGVVQNAYYDKEGNHDKLENYPNISFFLRAKNIDEAKEILNDMVVVKEHIALYTIYEVGSKWLGRKTEVINEKGMSNSFVAVWNTATKHDDQAIADKIKDNAKEQTDAVLALWEKGEVENIYFDVKGINKLDHITDFVMFVNAASIDEARAKMEALPFAQKQIASFQIHPVGVFWMGEYDEE